MVRYDRYLRYVLVHKWFVMIECFKRGLFWRGLVHDLSKLRPSELFPYARHFYGGEPQVRDRTGYYKPTDTGDPAFDAAWFWHQKRNDHHWQWWTMPDEPPRHWSRTAPGQAPSKVFPMSAAARAEMLCDWKGAGRAQGTPDVGAWYRVNVGKMLLHPETSRWIEAELARDRAEEEE